MTERERVASFLRKWTEWESAPEEIFLEAADGIRALTEQQEPVGCPRCFGKGYVWGLPSGCTGLQFRRMKCECQTAPQPPQDRDREAMEAWSVVGFYKDVLKAMEGAYGFNARRETPDHDWASIDYLEANHT